MPPLFIQFPVVINGWLRLHTFIDTAATATLMSPQLQQACNLQLDSRFLTHLDQVDGSTTSIGRVTFNLQIASQTQQVEAFVIERLKYSLLIGSDTGKKFKMLCDLESGKAFLKRDSHSQPSQVTSDKQALSIYNKPDSHLGSKTHSNLDSILHHYSSVFAKSDDDLGNITVETHKIRTLHENPIYKRQFRFSISENDIIRKIVRGLLKQQ